MNKAGDGIRQAVADLASACETIGIENGDPLAPLARQLPVFARSMADAADQMEAAASRLEKIGTAPASRDREIIAAVERASTAIAHRIRVSVDRRTSIFIGIALIASAALGAAATYDGLRLAGLIR